MCPELDIQSQFSFVLRLHTYCAYKSDAISPSTLVTPLNAIIYFHHAHTFPFFHSNKPMHQPSHFVLYPPTHHYPYPNPNLNLNMLFLYIFIPFLWLGLDCIIL